MTKEQFEHSYQTHFKLVWNLCYTYLNDPTDTEDAVQDTFLKLAMAKKDFRDGEHEKAWLIVTARNVCKDELKRSRRREVPLEVAAAAAAEQPRMDETLELVRSLPEQYQTVIYLYYYEGYATKQIARLLGKPDATVRSDLRRGRLLMKKGLEGTR